jgi:hypothetical protein
MKTLGGFAFRFALIFILLAWPWQGLRNVFRACFREQARWLIDVWLPDKSSRVENFSDPRFPNLDTMLVVAERRDLEPIGSSQQVLFDSSTQGWIPLAMLTALCIATPLPWSKRLKALVAGTVVIEIIVAATVVVGVSFILVSANSAIPCPQLLIFANHLLGENIWFSFVPPFLLWALWLAWGGHWQELAQRLAGNDPRGFSHKE